MHARKHHLQRALVLPVNRLPRAALGCGCACVCGAL